jgi:hypothetical protein
MIDLDQGGIRALTDPVRPMSDQVSHGVIAVFFYRRPAQQLFLQAQVHSPQSKGLSYPSLVIFFSRPALSGLSKQGPVFRNSYAPLPGHRPVA